MIRYTTPVLICRVPLNITDAQIYVSIRQNEVNLKYKVDPEDTSYDDEEGETTIKAYFTQKQTAKLRKDSAAEIQVNWIYSDGNRNATRIRKIKTTDNLIGEVLQYGD